MKIPTIHTYLNEQSLAELAIQDRLAPVLVRFDRGRLTCPAQDAKPIIEALEAQGWCCRDVEQLRANGHYRASFVKEVCGAEALALLEVGRRAMGGD